MLTNTVPGHTWGTFEEKVGPAFSTFNKEMSVFWCCSRQSRTSVALWILWSFITKKSSQQFHMKHLVAWEREVSLAIGSAFVGWRKCFTVILHFWGFRCCFFWVETISHHCPYPSLIFNYKNKNWKMTYMWSFRCFKDTWLDDAGCSKTPLGFFFGLFLNFPDGGEIPRVCLEICRMTAEVQCSPCLIEFQFLGPHLTGTLSHP